MFLLYLAGFAVAGIGFTILIDKFIGGGKSPTPNHQDINTLTVNQLEAIRATHGDLTISQTLELLNPQATPNIPTTSSPQPQASNPPDTSLNTSLENWYKLNTISLLLYLGALLILVSAYVFVQFQWEAFSGLTKASLLSLLGFSFFGFGWWFNSLPKVRLAGITFIGLSALLIPVIGYGWHTFVFAPMGIPLWQVWSLFSIASLLFYFVLAVSLNHQFYGYCASLAGVSSFVAITHSTQPSIDMYLFSILLTGLSLLIASHLIGYLKPIYTHTLSQPWYLVAHLLTPSAFIFGFIQDISQNQFYTTESILAVFLTIIFYLVTYLIKRDNWLIVIIQFLGLIAVWATTGTLTQDTGTIILSVQGYTIISLLSSYLWRQSNQTEQSQIISLSSVAGSTILVPVAHFLSDTSSQISPIQLVIIAAIAILTNILFSHFKRTSYNLALIPILSYYIITQIAQIQPYIQTNLDQLISFCLVSLSLVSYALSQTRFSRQSVKEGLYIVTGISLLISFYSATQTQIPYLFYTLSLAAILLHFSRQTQEALYLYAAHACLHWSLYILSTSILTIDQQYLPFIFSFFSILIYTIGSTLPAISAKNWQYSALFTGITIPYYLYITIQVTQINSLVATYLGCLLLVIHALRSKIDNHWYIATLATIITLLWNFSYLSITEPLAYSLPLGVYLLGLGAHRRLRLNPNEAAQLESIGLVILSIIPMVLSFSGDPVRNTLVLGFLSLVFLVIGITANLKHYTYAGIACLILAVIPHTYQYILLIPRWLLIGILGISFLTGAIFLLNKRDQTPSQTPPLDPPPPHRTISG